MKLFIAEDEAPARERLIETIGRVAPQARLLGHAASVAETRRWLASHEAPDLLLLDIQLADGLSIELFADGPLALPTIFTTAFDSYALAAFKALAIDYLLKPVQDAALAQAFAKVQALRQRFAAAQAEALLAALRTGATRHAHRQRWLARQGAGHTAVAAADVAYFVSLDKISFVISHDGTRRMLDETLAEVEAEADPSAFFRINRQMIVAASAIRRFAAEGKGRLALELAPPFGAEVIVPQERAAAFRQWLAR